MYLERIKNMREDLDMTQKELAKILNISQRTLSHYELGTRDVPTQVLIALADFYKCSTDELNQIGIKIDMYRQEYRFTPAFAFIQAV